MGNYVYLIGSNEKNPLNSETDSIFFLSAKYDLPLFWLLLFRYEDYALVVDAKEEDPECENRYPFLSATKSDVIKTASGRETYLLSLLPKKWADLWFEFIQFIKSSECAYIHFSQQEHACLCDSFDIWQSEQQEVLTGFNKNPIFYRGKLIFKRKYLEVAWYRALNMANIDFPYFRNIKPWNLVGGEGEFVPSKKYMKMWH